MTIRRYRKGDEKQIQILFNKVFNSELTYNTWKWKFLDNPAESNPLILLYEEKNTIIGHVSLWVHDAFINGKRKRVALRIDTMVDPSARGKGIYQQLNEQMLKLAKEEDITLLYGFPAPEAKKLLQRYTGAVHLTNVPRWVYIANPITVASLKLKPLKILSFLDKLYSYGKRKIKNSINSDGKVVKKSIFNESIQILANKTKHDYQVMLVRDEQYLSWRYHQHPINDYQTLCYYDQDEPVGYIIYKININDDGVKIGYIIDLITLKEKSLCIQKALLDKAIWNMKDVALIQAWSLPHQRTTKALKEVGFFHKDNPMPLVVNNIRPDIINVTDASQWFINLGDVDSY